MPGNRAVITEPQLVGDMDEDWYHFEFGPVPEGSLSVSGAKKLLPPSCPAVFDWERRHPKPPSTEMELGTVVHGMLLGTGQPVEVCDFPDWRTNKAKDAKAAAIGRGAVPMLPHQYAEAEAIAQAVRDDDECGGLLAESGPGEEETDSEVSMFWRDDEHGIWCRGRLDRLTWFEGTPTIVDVKTCADSSPEAFAKSVDKFGYYMQDAWYREGLAILLGCDDWRDVEFVFVTVPTERPYLPMAYRLDATDRADPWHDVLLGRERNRIAREKYRDCTANGTWPKWSADITPLSLPGYARKRIEDSINDWHR